MHPTTAAECAAAAGIQATIEQLHQTILWCSRRQILIDLTSGLYTSSLSPIDAKSFIRSVASTLTTFTYAINDDTEHLHIAVDEKMCRLALDNAATNAAAHGSSEEIRFGAFFKLHGNNLFMQQAYQMFPQCSK